VKNKRLEQGKKVPGKNASFMLGFRRVKLGTERTWYGAWSGRKPRLEIKKKIQGQKKLREKERGENPTLRVVLLFIYENYSSPYPKESQGKQNACTPGKKKTRHMKEGRGARRRRRWKRHRPPSRGVTWEKRKLKLGGNPQ